MAIKPRGKGIPRVTEYQALSAFAVFIVVSMTGNASYPTPSPTLATITTEQATLDALIAAWGPVGARGSHADLMALRAQALLVRNLLVQELGYVQNTAVALGGDYAAQTATIISSGFGVKNAGIPQGVLGQPESFSQLFKNNISTFFVGLDWKKPLGLSSPGNVKQYQVWRNAGVNNFNAVGTVCIGTTTRTRYIDKTADLSVANYYWCTASNDEGIGAPTAAVIVPAVI